MFKKLYCYSDVDPSVGNVIDVADETKTSTNNIPYLISMQREKWNHCIDKSYMRYSLYHLHSNLEAADLLTLGSAMTSYSISIIYKEI